MKSLPRRMAKAVLQWLSPTSNSERSAWVSAMLGELDAIEGNWVAFAWALGCASAIVRRALSDRVSKFVGGGAVALKCRMALKRQLQGAVLGSAFSAATILVAFATLGAMRDSPGSGVVHAGWAQVLIALVIPEMVFALAIWRLRTVRRPAAIGVALFAAILAAHVAIHLASAPR